MAILLGALIGTERQFASNQVDKYIGGIRTFVFLALGGSIAAYIEDRYIPNFFLLAFIATFLLVLANYIFVTSKSGEPGTTTEFVSPIVFSLGGLSWWQEYGLTIALTIIVLFFLSSKRMFQQLTTHFTYEDIRASTVLLVLSGIVLPIVPNQWYGPYLAFNPYRIWLFIILVSSLSFAAYIVLKIFRQSLGIVVTGILGGLISSTAATIALAKRSKESPAYSQIFSEAAVVASAIMPFRAVIFAIIVLPQNWITIFPIALPGLLIGAWLSNKLIKEKEQNIGQLQISNPFRLKEATQFGIIFAAATLLSKAAKEWLGENAIVMITGLSGVLSVDAAVLSLGEHMGNVADHAFIPMSIAAAIFTNCIAKIGIAYYFGTEIYRKNTMKWFLIIGITSFIPLLIHVLR
ncbi:MAG: DUF4010 domain-containing protein [bacterium]|nr:DUF4010 domain-containing protein [bacterium]